MPAKAYLKKDGRDKLLKGINIVTDVVSVTLGPSGKNVAIGKAGGAQPKITKDGVTVAMSMIGDDDPVVDMGMQIIRDASMEAYRKTGDGTTTATVLGRALIMSGLEEIESGAKVNDVIEGIRQATKIVVDSIGTQAKHIDINSPELQHIATISANNDSILGGHIAECIRHVGAKGVTTVGVSDTLETHVEKKTGMVINRGFIAQEFVTDERKRICVLENPLVLIYDRKISSLIDIRPILDQCIPTKRSLLIIAEDVDSEALNTLVLNAKSTNPEWLKTGIKFCAIKTPNFMNRMSFLEDIAIYTGGTVIAEKTGSQISKAKLQHLGSAERIIVTDWDTTIINGAGTKAEIDARLEIIDSQGNEEISEKQKEVYKERYAALSGTSSVIYIGRTSGMEISEIKDRVDDSVKATKAALEEGIVAGGGMALLNGAHILEQHQDANKFKTAINALRAPLNQMLENDGSVLTAENIFKVLGSFDTYNGYNVKTNSFCDMFADGIIDPAKVVRTALEQASYVACMFLSTNAVVLTY